MIIEAAMEPCACGCGGPVLPLLTEALELRGRGMTWRAVGAQLGIGGDSAKALIQRSKNPPRFRVGHQTAGRRSRRPRDRYYDRLESVPDVILSPQQELELLLAEQERDRRTFQIQHDRSLDAPLRGSDGEGYGDAHGRLAGGRSAPEWSDPTADRALRRIDIQEANSDLWHSMAEAGFIIEQRTNQ